VTRQPEAASAFVGASTLHQRVTCCTKPVKTADLEDTLDMTGDLKIRFCRW
jgi:hypothetical protein